MASNWRTDFPRSVSANRRINENALSAASGGGPDPLIGDVTGQLDSNVVEWFGNLQVRVQGLLASRRIAIGPTALGGTDSVLIGHDISAVQTNARQVIIGAFTGTNITSAGQCTIVGASAGTAITTGSDNICIGHQSGGFLATGTNNVLVGNVAGAAAAVIDAVCIGAQSTANNDSSICIGKSAVSNVNNGIAIGSAAVASVYGVGAGAPISIVTDASATVAAVDTPSNSYIRIKVNGQNFLVLATTIGA